MPEPSGVIAPDALRAMAHSGCFVTGLRVDGELVGGGFGWSTHTDGEWRLHSHVVGFLDGHRRTGLGRRFKHHQRDWVAARQMQAVEWTFDPLVAANARFNLSGLGARVTSFHHDFYGIIDDEFSGGLGSDRFLVRWGLDDEPPEAAEPDTGWPAILFAGEGDRPVIRDVGDVTVRASIPADIIGIRRRDPGLARAWTDDFAATVGAAVRGGGRILCFHGDRSYIVDRQV